MGFFDSLGDMVSDGFDYVCENPVKSLGLLAVGVATGGAAYAAMTAVGGLTAAGAVGVVAAEAAVGSATAATASTMLGTATSTAVRMAAVELTKAVTATQVKSAVVVAAKAATGSVCAKTAYDKVAAELRDCVDLEPGSIVYCNLFGALEHSGIYVGGGQIVELTGKGEIRMTNISGFTEGTGSSGVYVACHNGKVLSCNSIKNRAMRQEGDETDYHVLFNNCHKFTSSCLNGDTNNLDTSFWLLGMEVKNYFGVDSIEWRTGIPGYESHQSTTASNNQTHHNAQTAVFQQTVKNEKQITYLIVINDQEIEVKDVEKTLEVLARMMHDRCLQVIETYKQAYFDKTCQLWEEYGALKKAHDDLKEISGMI